MKVKKLRNYLIISININFVIFFTSVIQSTLSKVSHIHSSLYIVNPNIYHCYIFLKVVEIYRLFHKN